MEKIKLYTFFVIYLIVVNIFDLFFFLQRRWVPDKYGVLESEIDYLFKELQSANLYAYLILIINILLIVFIIFIVIDIIKKIKRKFVN